MAGGKRTAEQAGLEERPKKAGEEPSDDEEFEEESEEEIVEGSDEEDEEDEEGRPTEKRVWRPGIDPIEEGEELTMDMSTYDMLHRAQVEWPCLSFDILPDDLGAQRSQFPMTAYVLAGTQAEKAVDNCLLLMKWSKLCRTTKDGDSDSESESDDEDEPVLETRRVKHPGVVNRVRVMPQAKNIVATWADTGKVHVWNVDAQLKSLEKPGRDSSGSAAAKPIFTCDGHKGEGYAIDFSPHKIGRILSGGNDHCTLLWEPVKGGWKVEETAFRGHTGSVEDVQWKRQGAGCPHLFATASSDKSFRVWDARESDRTKSCQHQPSAHASDINVLSWSPMVGELLATGGDDGCFKVWDTRNLAAGAMANFGWHKKPITSVDWHPTDETSLLVASEDNCVTLWDMAVEDDTMGQEQTPGMEHYPPQMMFLHMGQTDVKEAKWHRQMPGVCVTTAATGFNIFKACNQ